MNSIDPISLSLPTSGKSHTQKRDSGEELPTHFPGERFLKGPISWNWLCEAANLPGRALHVAIGIWHLAGLEKKRTLKLSQKILRELGLNRYAAYRGLSNLENAGLVSVERHSGRNSKVTILNVKQTTKANPNNQKGENHGRTISDYQRAEQKNQNDGRDDQKPSLEK